jgi:hypothetical protein
MRSIRKGTGLRSGTDSLYRSFANSRLYLNSRPGRHPSHLTECQMRPSEDGWLQGHHLSFPIGRWRGARYLGKARIKLLNLWNEKYWLTMGQYSLKLKSLQLVPQFCLCVFDTAHGGRCSGSFFDEKCSPSMLAYIKGHRGKDTCIYMFRMKDSEGEWGMKHEAVWKETSNDESHMHFCYHLTDREASIAFWLKIEICNPRTQAATQTIKLTRWLEWCFKKFVCQVSSNSQQWACVPSFSFYT